MKHLRRNTYLIALDRRGKTYSSKEMAGVLEKLALEGKGDITFVIGDLAIQRGVGSGEYITFLFQLYVSSPANARSFTGTNISLA